MRQILTWVLGEEREVPVGQRPAHQSCGVCRNQCVRIKQELQGAYRRPLSSREGKEKWNWGEQIWSYRRPWLPYQGTAAFSAVRGTYRRTRNQDPGKGPGKHSSFPWGRLFASECECERMLWWLPAKGLILQNEMSLLESHGNLESNLTPNTRSSYIKSFCFSIPTWLSCLCWICPWKSKTLKRR